MRVRSLGLRTDLMFASWEGIVDDLGDAIRARTPDNPDYYYGNFLLFPDAPASGDAARWIARFQEAFAGDPRIAHVCLRWDSPDGVEGAASELEPLGFTIDRGTVLTARAVVPPRRPNREITIRAIRPDADADWSAVDRLQVATSIASYGPSCEPWAHAMVGEYRRLVSARRGLWFGAFMGDSPDAPLAADLGIFVDSGVARFRSVETDPAYRNRGICATLVHHAATAALSTLGADLLVMVADPTYHAARIYESVGFAPTEKMIAALKHPTA